MDRDMKLYYSPGACSLSPHIVLREAGLAFTLDRIDYATRKTESGRDYGSINPKGQVPALELETGEVLTEGAVIVQYIADKKPETGLAPKPGSMERYRLQEWLNYLASELHKTFSPLFNPKTPDEFRAMVKERLSSQFAYLNERLGKSPFLAGPNFSIADAYAFTVLHWTKSKRVAIDLGGWPNLQAYMDRIAARPKVQEALKAEGLAG
jgi:glutathione S-transferase